MSQMTWEEFSRLYCETQEQTPEGLRAILERQTQRFQPTGFLLARCVMMDSSYFGTRVILPYGGSATRQEVPTRPFSPRGLASDMSEVEGVLLTSDFTAEVQG